MSPRGWNPSFQARLLPRTRGFCNHEAEGSRPTKPRDERIPFFCSDLSRDAARAGLARVHGLCGALLLYVFVSLGGFLSRMSMIHLQHRRNRVHDEPVPSHLRGMLWP
jgi:hypothetical protein